MPDGPTREHLNRELSQARDPAAAPTDRPLPTTDDPGGAHTKGYSADPRTEAGLTDDGPVPLAPLPEDDPGVIQPERDGKVRPTGRSKPGDYTPNDRLMGSDR